MSYPSERKQRVKIGNSRSSWSEMIKGVPQGPLLGPLLFNVHNNDIFNVIESLYNYADYTFLSCSGDSLQEVVAWKYYLNGSKMVRKQFDESKSEQVPSDFAPKAKADDICFNINENMVEANIHSKQLVSELMTKLTFDEHKSRMCMKAARQSNYLQKIAKYLSQRTKYVVFISSTLSNFSFYP